MRDVKSANSGLLTDVWTYVEAGTRDRMLPKSTPAAVARVLTDVSVHYIEAGHRPAAEQPSIVAASIDIFLRSGSKPIS